MTYDAIIIGGGLGGLTAGAKLAREGKKVLLIEQHSVTGGCAATIRRENYLQEQTLHGFYGLDDLDPVVSIFEELEVFENVTFIRTPELYRFTNDRIDLVLANGTGACRETLARQFPGETAGIDRFFETLIGIRRELASTPKAAWRKALRLPLLPFLYRRTITAHRHTLGSFMDTIFGNEDLKLALTANIGGFHVDPYTLSLSFFAIGQSKLLQGGSHFIKGGSQRLTEHLAGFIEANGGTILVDHLVTRIIVEGGAAVGVEYRKTDVDTASSTERVTAGIIIANAAVPNVVHDLLPAEAAAGLKRKIAGWLLSTSVLSIYFYLRKSLKALGNRHYQTLLFHRDTQRLKDLPDNFAGDLRQRSIALCDYSQLDSGLVPEGKGFASINTPDQFSDWDQLTDEEDRSRKTEIADIMTHRLERLFPGVKDQIEDCTVISPLDIRERTLNPGGCPMGFAQIPSQAVPRRVRRRSPVRQLYFASSWSTPGGSYPAVLECGYECAVEALEDQRS